jgi:hypothetical protein
VHGALVTPPGLGLVGPVGVDGLEPALHVAQEVLVLEAPGRGDEHLLVAGEGLLDPRVADPHQHGHVLGRDVTVEPGLFGQRHGAQGPAQADPAVAHLGGQVGAEGHVGRRAAGPGVHPVLGGVERGGGPGHDGVEAEQLEVQILDRVAGPQVVRIHRGQLVNRLRQGPNSHVPILPGGCDKNSFDQA